MPPTKNKYTLPPLLRQQDFNGNHASQALTTWKVLVYEDNKRPRSKL